MVVVSDFKEMVSEQLEYRELLGQMAFRDLLLRYKQTAMGFSWAIFMPLINTAVFSVIFTRVAKIETPVPYPLFAFSGLLFWNFFASSLRFSVVSLTGNSNLVQKIYFPREIFPFSAIFVCLVDLLVGSLVLIALMIYYQVAVHFAILLLPVILLIHVIFTAGVALFLAMSNLFYRDVKYLFEVLITVWMFATAVVYPLGHVSGALGVVLALNPMTQVIDAYRQVLLYGQLPAFLPLFLTALASCVVLAGSWLMFHRAEFKFAENI
jgi:ABC-2 type transport system permease protein/lipopolysaccharide transport system permease protein